MPGVSGLGQKYVFIKKSTIFTQSLRNFDKRRPSTHEDLILTKFRNGQVKIVDFLIKARGSLHCFHLVRRCKSVAVRSR